MKIYKIIDTQMEDKPRVGELFTRIQTAKKQANKMLSNHVHRVAVKINKMTGIKRGANVQQFNELVKSIADPRFIIETIEVNDSWR